MTSAYGAASVGTDAPTNPAVPFRFEMLSTALSDEIKRRQSRHSGIGPTSLPPPELTIYSFLQKIMSIIDPPSVDSTGTDDGLSISESNERNESNKTIYLKNTMATSTKYRKGEDENKNNKHQQTIPRLTI